MKKLNAASPSKGEKEDFTEAEEEVRQKHQKPNELCLSIFFPLPRKCSVTADTTNVAGG